MSNHLDDAQDLETTLRRCADLSHDIAKHMSEAAASAEALDLRESAAIRKAIDAYGYYLRVQHGENAALELVRDGGGYELRPVSWRE